MKERSGPVEMQAQPIVRAVHLAVCEECKIVVGEVMPAAL